MANEKNFIPARDNVDYSRIYEYDNLKSINGFKFFKGNRAVSARNVKELTLKPLSQKDLNISEDVYDEVKTMISKLGWTRGAWMESFIMAWKSVRGGEYKYLLDEMGFDYFSNHIFSEMRGVQSLTGKPMWENQFKHLILNINQLYRTA